MTRREDWKRREAKAQRGVASQLFHDGEVCDTPGPDVMDGALSRDVEGATISRRDEIEAAVDAYRSSIEVRVKWDRNDAIPWLAEDRLREGLLAMFDAEIARLLDELRRVEGERAAAVGKCRELDRYAVKMIDDWASSIDIEGAIDTYEEERERMGLPAMHDATDATPCTTSGGKGGGLSPGAVRHETVDLPDGRVGVVRDHSKRRKNRRAGEEQTP